MSKDALGSDDGWPPLAWAAVGASEDDPLHDSRCEQEFISGPNALSPCGCRGRLVHDNTEAPR